MLVVLAMHTTDMFLICCAFTWTASTARSVIAAQPWLYVGFSLAALHYAAKHSKHVQRLKRTKTHWLCMHKGLTHRSQDNRAAIDDALGILP